jgi:hypothetical protein
MSSASTSVCGRSLPMNRIAKLLTNLGCLDADKHGFELTQQTKN